MPPGEIFCDVSFDVLSRVRMMSSLCLRRVGATPKPESSRIVAVQTDRYVVAAL
jgi:hypothetical protein